MIDLKSTYKSPLYNQIDMIKSQYKVLYNYERKKQLKPFFLFDSETVYFLKRIWNEMLLELKERDRCVHMLDILLSFIKRTLVKKI